MADANRDPIIITLSIQAGKQVFVEIDLNKSEGKGFFPTQRSNVIYKGKSYPVTNGFIMLNEDVGKLVSQTRADKAGVIYQHEKSGDQQLLFYASTGERALLNVINIPIHDHSSIVQGGPAFGSYYSAIKNNE